MLVVGLPTSTERLKLLGFLTTAWSLGHADHQQKTFKLDTHCTVDKIRNILLIFHNISK